MLKDRHGFTPFGWSVGCGGQRPGEVRDEVRSAVEATTQRFGSYFPPDRGYEVSAHSPAGASNGVQLQVRRGDFKATVAIEAILDPNRKSPDERAIRMYGRAESEAVVSAERDGYSVVRRFRAVGLGVGVIAFFGALWLSLGAQSPIYVLGGLLMVVSALLTTSLGASMGAWIGERIAEKERNRARVLTSGDPRFQDDLRRWRALARQLANQRQALTGRVGAAPFRALPAANDASTRTPARGLPRLAPTSSFSFSS